MGKGDKRRPCCLTQEAEKLQWDLFEGKISKANYYIQRTVLQAKGKWWRK